jgi:serine/threonine-protein kinase RsbW
MPNFKKIIQLPALPENISLILSNIRNFLQKEGAETERINKIELAIEELLVNILNYSYPDKIGDVEVSYSFYNSSDFIVKIVDMGIPFNPLLLNKADVSSSLEERKAGGLGIYFVKKIVDNIEYRHYREKNILKLVFKNINSQHKK